MEQKLQALTEKIYAEGVEKASRQAAQIVAEAEKKARRLLEDAQREAEEIRQTAREEAEEWRENATTELRLSAAQAIRALRQEIGHLVTMRVLKEPMAAAFRDPAFLREIILTLVRNWRPDGGPVTLALLLPETEEEQLEEYFAGQTAELLNKELQVTFDGRLENGFRIGPANGRYVISFTEEDFTRFFRDHLRPVTAELLYGEK